MSQSDWNSITREDVIKAIALFRAATERVLPAKSTFLLFEGQTLPAKHIRGMAYRVAHGVDISKQAYAGGMETVRFFERLGFEVRYTGATARPFPAVRPSCKIGLYLQTNDHCFHAEKLHQAIEIVRKSDIDLFVFPEGAYFTFVRMCESSDIFNREDVERLSDRTIQFSQTIGKAVIISSIDRSDTPFSLFANAFADGDETKCALYIKHTMADRSAFEMDDYAETLQAHFPVIRFKGFRIGMTICYDCNHAPFSRMYGLQGVDIIVNSTGGNVIDEKWYKYNKVRAIENHCYTFVTMGGNKKESHSVCKVYGFSPQGKYLHPVPHAESEQNGIYIYDTATDDGGQEEDRSLMQAPSVNKHIDIFVPMGNIEALLKKSDMIAPNVYVYRYQEQTVVFCVVYDKDILQPEKVLPLLYHDKLKPYKNKRYIIVSKYHHVEKAFYQNQLSVVLKVRSMENFCAVLLESDDINQCFQCGKNRTAQVIRPVNGAFGIDLSRTTGPEAIWKNKVGMKAAWRGNYEFLVKHMI